MNEQSRKYYATRNILFSIAYKVVDVVLAFILRTVFIYSLGVEYLGISGLFASILNILSLMELGIGSAIAFSLYRPLAEKDHGKITALMRLYKRVYTSIGCIVCIVGVGLTAFLSRIINLPDEIPHLYLIYWISIANVAGSYFLAYRRTLLVADQRMDICNKVDITFRFFRFTILTIVLVSARSYILYLTLDVATTISSNLVISWIVRKRYPYIKNGIAATLDKTEKQNIVKYMSSTIFTKFGQTVVTSTDSIIISAFISTTLVGYYSNYHMLYSNLDIIVYLIFSSITASVGNYAVTNNGTASYKLFRKINLSNFMIVGIVTVCFYSLASPFVTLWLGEQYLLPDITVIIIALNFFLTANNNSISNFMSAMGELHYKNRFRALIEGIINLISSILLVKYTGLGITAVFLGTTISFISGRVWMDPWVLHRYWFQVPFHNYMKSYLLRGGLCIVLCVILKQMTSRIFHVLGISVFSWILCALVCVAITISTFLVIWWKSEELRYLFSLFFRIQK